MTERAWGAQQLAHMVELIEKRIPAARARIEAKLDDPARKDKVENYKARLAEFDAIEAEVKRQLADASGDLLASVALVLVAQTPDSKSPEQEITRLKALIGGGD
jgi:hypothetical protein